MDKRVAIDLFGDSIPVTRGNVYDLFISACIQVKPILISTAAPTDAQGFEAYILSIPPSNSAIFHLLSLRSATAGHSVAIYQTGNDLYFFDCNSGEYQINSLRELFTELHSNYTGLTLASIFSYTF